MGCKKWHLYIVQESTKSRNRCFVESVIHISKSAAVVRLETEWLTRNNRSVSYNGPQKRNENKNINLRRRQHQPQVPNLSLSLLLWKRLSITQRRR
mmetsp:Transcript_17849/g.42115  ORF Transcript_17849/g.42115 Transcript_17849/m.42115 type:complete len:96 (+) Transcript_17849:30-317(+)